MVSFLLYLKMEKLNMVDKIEHFRFLSWWQGMLYIALLFSINIIIRAVFSALRALAAKYDPKEEQLKHVAFYNLPTYDKFKIIFRGVREYDKTGNEIGIREPHPDLRYNSILGFIELLTFPILLRVDGYAIVGAWIAFKTVAQWSKWTQYNRLTFNRYLIGCAIQVLISFTLMHFFIH